MNTHDTPTAPPQAEPAWSQPDLPRAELTMTRHCPLAACGQKVRRGERIATSNAPGLGDIHSPLAGTVTHVDAYRIRVEAAEPGTLDPKELTVDPVDLPTLSGQELLTKLHELGADLPPADTVDTLILNGADCEPDIFSRQELLASTPATLERGLQTAVALYTPKQTVLAVLKGTQRRLEGADLIEISEQYPAGLDPMVACTVTGREAPENTVVLGLETLYQLGRIAETGLPAMETMVTVGRTNRLVTVGTPAGLLLEKAGEKPASGDRIVLGGVLRGVAASSPGQGVARDTSAVSIIANPAPVAEDAPCVGCGECVRRCPARLDPAMLTSYAEFGMYDKAEAAHVDVCFECGLCGFFCIARRPMLQYIRLAKNELARERARTAEDTLS
jgi:electron transport complex protein RnfC